MLKSPSEIRPLAHNHSNQKFNTIQFSPEKSCVRCPNKRTPHTMSVCDGAQRGDLWGQQIHLHYTTRAPTCIFAVALGVALRPRNRKKEKSYTQWKPSGLGKHDKPRFCFQKNRIQRSRHFSRHIICWMNQHITIYLNFCENFKTCETLR